MAEDDFGVAGWLDDLGSDEHFEPGVPLGGAGLVAPLAAVLPLVCGPHRGDEQGPVLQNLNPARKAQLPAWVTMSIVKN